MPLCGSKTYLFVVCLMFSNVRTTYFNSIWSYFLSIWQISFCYLVSSCVSMFYGFFFKPRIGEIIFFNLHLLHGPAGPKINPFLYGECITVVLLCNLLAPTCHLNELPHFLLFYNLSFWHLKTSCTLLPLVSVSVS